MTAAPSAASDWALLRKGLWPLAALYGLGAAVRNWLFDAGLRRSYGVDVPVISVGNLAAGGTGKTPLVVWLVGRLLAVGRRPGVLARGYGRREGEALNDEGQLLARRFADLPQVQDPDRVAGARRLVALGADVLVVDDGFQHRRLERSRDLVCVDAERPFAGGMLPTGLLREFPKGLRRADAIVLTRAGRFTADSVEQRVAQLREFGRKGVRVLATDHAVVRLREMPDGTAHPVTALAGRRVVLLSGIARPETFERTVADLGAEIVEHVRRRDHHLHTVAEVQALDRRAEAADAVLVTTEKDDVKLAGLEVERWVVELDLEFLGEELEIEWLLARDVSE